MSTTPLRYSKGREVPGEEEGEEPYCYQEAGGPAEYYCSQVQIVQGGKFLERRKVKNHTAIRRRGDQPSTTPLRYSTGREVSGEEEGEET